MNDLDWQTELKGVIGINRSLRREMCAFAPQAGGIRCLETRSGSSIALERNHNVVTG